MEGAYAVTVQDSTQTGEARRTAMQLAERLGFDETAAGNVGLVVTEAAKNLLKHAGGGDLLIQPLRNNDTFGIEMLAIDKGRGIENIRRSFEDGYSTAGTPGTGLGAISRLSTLHDIYSQAGMGTALLAQIWNSPTAPGPERALAFRTGGISIAMPGEAACGDAWSFLDVGPDGGRVIIADGLGHGLLAAAAARSAIQIFEQFPGEAGVHLMQHIHHALRPTRGAAVAVADIDRATGTVRYTGIGNISGVVISPSGGVQHMVSHAGTAGHEVQKIVEFRYAWEPASLLVMHSDGLVSHWSLARYPGLALRHPSVVAGVLYRDYNRGRDDTTVVAVREDGPA